MILTSELIVSLIDQVTAPARAAAASVGRLKDAAKSNAEQMAAMRGSMIGAVAGAAALATAMVAPVHSALAFESAMADVKKVVNFETPQAFADMKKQVLDLSTELPMTATGIADIVAAAGQAGMADRELAQFAEMAAKVGIAFDISAGQAGESLAKIKTALDLSVDETGKLADAINYLSNTSASSAPDILDFMRRVGSQGKQYGFTAAQTAAIGSAMIAAGAQADVAGTSFANVGRALARGANATKSQRKAFAAIGLDAKKVAKSLQVDAVGTLNDVIERIRALPKHLQASTISSLFGDEARAIAPLIENADLLKKSLGAVADEASYLGSAQAEYETRAATAGNAIQLLRNIVEKLSISIGTALLPAIVDVVKAISPYISALADLAIAHPVAVQAIVALVGGLVALKIASIAARFAFLALKGGMLDLAIVGARAAGAMTLLGGPLKLLAAPLTMLVGSVRAARTALVGFAASARIVGIAGASQIALAGLGQGFVGLVNPIGLVRVALVALRLALITTGIGALVVGLAAAGVWIYNNWSGLAAMFTGIGDAIAEKFPALGAAFQPLISAISAIWDTLSSLFGKVQMSDQEWRDMGRRWMTNLLDGLIANVEAVLAWFRDLPSRILATIGSIDIASLVSWPSMPDWLGGGGGGDGATPPATGEQPAKKGKPWRTKGTVSNAATAANDNAGIAGARAAGGAVRAGLNYLVGERGPELVTPTRDGFVHSATDTARMIREKIAGLVGAGRETLSGMLGTSNADAAPNGPTVPDIAGAMARQMAQVSSVANDNAAAAGRGMMDAVQAMRGKLADLAAPFAGGRAPASVASALAPAPPSQPPGQPGAAQGQQAGDRTITIGTIIIKTEGQADARSIANDLKRELEERLAGIQTDTGWAVA
ncbi:phage tail tape measure protein, TP901 family, core region [Hartmannibacter diazotrophicus]|uniref:Phage tail tape measure protein, TP901 family, core region n=1 Tax=Hartmannibacter diazotrophicus TaxID=1482074 RepID=A0A2C9D5S5_9HYPH|nr:phage tail tape measure protein [Hartmannibacter diazotrophicus]SON55540.1 phage tail tape measure protein, TP901 family, core region [Hartmannibacter diazotrophicus]